MALMSLLTLYFMSEHLRYFQVRSCGDWKSYPCSKISPMLQAGLWLWASGHWGPSHAHPWWGAGSVHVFLRAWYTCVQSQAPLTHTEVYVAEKVLDVLLQIRVGIVTKVNATKPGCLSCYTRQDIFNYKIETLKTKCFKTKEWTDSHNQRSHQRIWLQAWLNQRPR